jgi:uncharacterized spore protein YtfJ
MDLKDLLRRTSEHLSVSRAFGAAYEKDGSLIIPVAFVAGGGGGGGSDVAPTTHRHFDIEDDDDDLDDLDDLDEDDVDGGVSGPRGGSGGGFGGVVMPVGVYVVKDDQVRWVPAINTTFIAVAAFGLIRVLVRSSSRRRHHR